MYFDDIPSIVPGWRGRIGGRGRFTEGTEDYAWVMRRLTPTPLRVYLTALDLRAPIGNGVPKTSVHCNRPANPVLESSRTLVKSQTGWNWIDFAGAHDSMITQPDEIAKLLLTA